MKILIITLVVLISSRTAYSQDLGYFGRKHYFELSAQLAPAIGTSLIPQELYKSPKNGRLVSGSDYFHTNLSAIIGTVRRQNLCLSFEVKSSILQFIPGPISFISPIDYEIKAMKHERLTLNTLSFIPTFEIGDKRSILPIGLTHQIGLGLSINVIQKKDYQSIARNSFDQPDLDLYMKQNPNYIKDYSYPEFSLSYALKSRIPYSKKGMVTVGLRFQGNFGSTKGSLSKGIPKGQIESFIFDYRLASTIVSFTLGHAFSF